MKGGLISDRRREFFFSTISRRVLRFTLPPVRWEPWNLSRIQKRNMLEANDPPAYGAGMKNEL
jgi:hypothetical protein